jgi:hypothetical protein
MARPLTTYRRLTRIKSKTYPRQASTLRITSFKCNNRYQRQHGNFNSSKINFHTALPISTTKILFSCDLAPDEVSDARRLISCCSVIILLYTAFVIRLRPVSMPGFYFSYYRELNHRHRAQGTVSGISVILFIRCDC